MRITIHLAKETVQMEFSNPKTAQLIHDQIKAQGTYAGRWIEKMAIEEPKAKKTVNKNTDATSSVSLTDPK